MRSMDKTIEHRLAWLAGIIDGEGWIGVITRQRPYTSRKTGVVRHYAYAEWYVGISNTNPAMLCEVACIADIMAARYSYQLSSKEHGNRKEQQTITFASKADVKIILEAVLPYLVNKRPQAELVLRALAHRYGSDVRAILYRNSARIPLRMDETFREMAASIKTMNRRGLNKEN
jgi:hypothetical protein